MKSILKYIKDKIDILKSNRKLKKQKNKDKMFTKSQQLFINFLIMFMIYTLVGLGAVNADDNDFKDIDSKTEVTAENTLKPELNGSVTVKKEEDVEDIDKKKELAGDDYGLIEGLVINAVVSLADFLFDTAEFGLKVLGMESIDKLILIGDAPEDSNFISTLFTEQELDEVVLKLFGLFTGIFLMFIPTIIMKEGYTVAGSKGDSEKLAKAYRTFISILVSLLMVAFGLWFINILFMINYGIVNSFTHMFDIFAKGSFSFSDSSSKDIYDMISKAPESSTTSNAIEFANAIAKDQGNAFLSIVIRGAILVQTLMLNVIYKFRKYFLIYLIGFFPIACFGYVFDSYKPKTIETIKEIASNIFTQAIHSLFYCISIKFITLGSWGGLDIIVSLFMMTHVTDLIKSLLGANGSTSKIAQSLGMATAVGGLALLRGVNSGSNTSSSTSKSPVPSPETSGGQKPTVRSIGANAIKKSVSTAVRTTSKVGSIAIGASMIGTGNGGAAMAGMYGASAVESKARQGVGNLARKGKGKFDEGLDKLNKNADQKKEAINRMTSNGYKQSGSNINTKDKDETNVASFLR